MMKKAIPTFKTNKEAKEARAAALWRFVGAGDTA
jgi:hypothetical protein